MVAIHILPFRYSYSHLHRPSILSSDTANMSSSRRPTTAPTTPSTSNPTLSIDASIALRSNDSKLNSPLNNLPSANETLFDVMSSHYHQTIIAQIKDCQALRYAPSYLQTWDQESRLQKGMDKLMQTFSEFGNFDERYDYGVGDETIYLPHLANPNPNRKNIERRLVEWASECEGDSLPTFKEALKQTRKSGSAHQPLALSLDHVQGFRRLTQAEQKAYIAEWGKAKLDKDDKVDGFLV